MARVKGIFFTIDGIFAALLVVGSLIIISQFFIEEQETPQLDYLSQDLINSLSNIRIYEIDNPYVHQLIAQGNITHLNNTVIEQIGEFYVLNETEYAQTLSKIISSEFIPERFGFEILVNDESLLRNNSKSGLNEDLVSYKRLVSGFEKFKPLKGTTSKVFLEGISEKPFSSYLYFGGFVGQGNISAFIDDVPSDVNITELYLEVDAGDRFNLYLNEIQCNSTFYPSSGTMNADKWNISMCKDLFEKGSKNNFTIVFIDDISTSYLGGGFIRVDYLTDNMVLESAKDTTTKWLPEINGIVNLYSSFYVPGTLKHMNIFIHYDANNSNSTNNTLYLTIGNQSILRIVNLTGERSVLLDDTNLTALNYADISMNTVPIRIGFENVSFGFIFEGNADVALVTDVSGSMNREMNSDNSGNKRNCDWGNYGLSSTSRLSVAKCLDKEFTQDIINTSGNMVGLISYEETTVNGDIVYPTTDTALIDGTVGNASPETGYSAGGYTCICCGINSARDILTENLTRTVYIDQKESWKYNVNYFYTYPQNDTDGDSWYDVSYDDSGWPSGDAILGSTNDYIYTPTVDTEIGNSIGDIKYYLNLWEHWQDTSGAPNDFSSGTLNSTANTYGLGQGDDGWDWESSAFDYTGSVDFDGIVSGRLEIDSRDNTNDVSGAYGIEVNVTQEMFDLISNQNGQATISFDWWWNDRGRFGSSDEIWVKAAWNSSTSGVHYLGSDLDNGHTPSDTYNEIYADEDPDGDTGQQSYSQSITNWIEGPGQYYLILGGKLKRNDWNEDGQWYFDNIQIEISAPQTGIYFADLWENTGDDSGPPNDFSSGTINSTANTYGLGQGDDGWDWESGAFDYTSNVDFDGIVSGRLQIDSRDNNNDVSGAYGIEINITQEMYDIVTSTNGRASISFDWWWNDRSTFGSADEVWVKAAWNSSTSGVHYLGSDFDTGHTPSDAYNEIYADEDPDGDTGQQSYSQSITNWIEGPGQYYLILGGKLKRDDWDDEGQWYFDNIQVKITNLTNHYYFRKSFTVNSLDEVDRGVLSVLYDDSATVYLNGVVIEDTAGDNLAGYWNTNGKIIQKSRFRTGTNVIAVNLLNADNAAKFDLKLIGINGTRDKAMMVMTDGQANRECTEQGSTGDLDGDGSSDTASDDAIQAACDAKEDWGITVYAVGYSDNADELTLQSIADCGGGIFTKSDNITALHEFYQDVASSIVSASRHAQTIEIEGNLTKSKLFGDSYIWLNFTPEVNPPQFGEISVIMEEKNFENCTFNVTVPNGIRFTDTRLTSYSSEHWTDALLVNGNTVYNLSEYGSDYTALGDPFIVNIPAEYMNIGENVFFIRTGDSPENMTSCSLNNTLIYTALVDSSVSYSDVLENAEGCNWTIEFDNGNYISISVPPDYTGVKTCFYTNSSLSYDLNDTYDDAMFRLLDILDLDNDGRIFIDLKEQHFVIGALSVGMIPYPWGPAIAEVRVWK